ncbi:uncharacterized protein I206_104248 [Kwoniella pini CBS 10737]|uniref:Uncharacterized protein n=1 Tax=Kwoniella pini CBS 10737 TaxID=1296096 RepID=A0AAJ8MQU3_9TREE
MTGLNWWEEILLTTFNDLPNEQMPQPSAHIQIEPAWPTTSAKSSSKSLHSATTSATLWSSSSGTAGTGVLPTSSTS